MIYMIRLFATKKEQEPVNGMVITLDLASVALPTETSSHLPRKIDLEVMVERYQGKGLGGDL